MLNSLITKYYNFFSLRISFVSNGESQNKIICQSTLDTLELKKRLVYVISWKSKGAYNS